MPSLTAKVCAEPGCVVVGPGRYCHAHTKQAQRRRTREWNGGTASQRGYNAKWQRYRASYLAKHPLCESCMLTGRTTAATVVDHITPHKGDLDLFNAAANHQALCKPCHDSKTARGQ